MGTLSTQSASIDEATASPSYPVPVTKQGTRVVYDGNPAMVAGALALSADFYERTGHYKTLIEKNCKVLSNGSYAVDSLDAAPFVLNLISDLPAGEAYAFNKPAPDTTTRIGKFNVKSPGRPFDIKTFAGAYSPKQIILTVARYRRSRAEVVRKLPHPNSYGH